MAVLNNVPSVKFDKPIYLGMCILDYSKLLMYQFYYDILINYGQVIKLLVMTQIAFF